MSKRIAVSAGAVLLVALTSLAILGTLAALPAGCTHARTAAGVAGTEKSVFVVSPYLQNPSPTEMTILWITPRLEKTELLFGQGEVLDQHITPLSAPGSTAAPGTRPVSVATITKLASGQWAGNPQYLYKARLVGLMPGTDYRYQVLADGTKTDGAFRTFQAQSPAPSQNSGNPGSGGGSGSAVRKEAFTFAVYGDSRTGEDIHRQLGLAMAKQHPEFILHTGDMTLVGTFDNFLTMYFRPLAGVIDHIPVMPAEGNHEGDGVAYRAVFSTPGNHDWYSFDCGNAHIVSLDSLVGTTNRPKMLAWLSADLAASKADWKIVFYHYPSYDAGMHHTTWGRKDFLPLFRKYGVDLVLAGHSHGYQRFAPMFTPGQNDRHPITFLVTAGGGAELHSIDHPACMACAAREHHYVLFSISGGTLTGRAIDLTGEQFDSFTITKQAGQFDPAYLAGARTEASFEVAGVEK